MDAIRASAIPRAMRYLLSAMLLAVSGSASAEDTPPPSPPPAPAQSDFVFPQAVYNPPPRYPTGSADDYESGTVVVVLDVDPEGPFPKWRWIDPAATRGWTPPQLKRLPRGASRPRRKEASRFVAGCGCRLRSLRSDV